MQTTAETRRLMRLKQRLARSELHAAQLRKRDRARDAHEKFRLGALTELLGWDEFEFAETERLVAAVHEAANVPESDARDSCRIAGANWFERHKRTESLVPLIGTKVAPDERRARAHRLITIGGLFVHHALDGIDRATLFGVMLKVDRQNTLAQTNHRLELFQ